ncbi:hypothetical protein T492DRAFT_837757 [Pavlovales sp. CCMP2436]|nr:hypothetical protein T492DRAFT_837757 [Pavlovales sp. CCMP2436]
MLHGPLVGVSLGGSPTATAFRSSPKRYFMNDALTDAGIVSRQQPGPLVELSGSGLLSASMHEAGSSTRGSLPSLSLSLSREITAAIVFAPEAPVRTLEVNSRLLRASRRAAELVARPHTAAELVARPHTVAAGLPLALGAGGGGGARERTPGPSLGRAALRGIESAAIVSEASFESLASSALSAPPPFPSWEMSWLAPSEPAHSEPALRVPPKFAQITSSPLFDGKGVSPSEWEEIFKWTGAVWLRKEYPNDSAHFRRNEALALHRLLDLMLADAVGEDDDGPLLMARFEREQPVYETIRAELRKQVSLKCREQGWLLERIFQRYDDHLAATEPVFHRLSADFHSERAQKEMALAELRLSDGELGERSVALRVTLNELGSAREHLARERRTTERLQAAMAGTEASAERLREELGETAERNELLHAATITLRARLEAHSAELSTARSGERRALDECERLSLLRDEADDDAREANREAREAADKQRALVERHIELERDFSLARERSAELQETSVRAQADESSALRDLRKFRSQAEAAEGKLVKSEALAKSRATKLAQLEGEHAAALEQLAKADKQGKHLAFDVERLGARVEASKGEQGVRLQREAELRRLLTAAEERARLFSEQLALAAEQARLAATIVIAGSAQPSSVAAASASASAAVAAGAPAAEEAAEEAETEEDELARLQRSAAAMRAALDAQEAADQAAADAAAAEAAAALDVREAAAAAEAAASAASKAAAAASMMAAAAAASKATAPPLADPTAGAAADAARLLAEPAREQARSRSSSADGSVPGSRRSSARRTQPAVSQVTPAEERSDGQLSARRARPSFRGSSEAGSGLEGEWEEDDDDRWGRQRVGSALEFGGGAELRERSVSMRELELERSEWAAEMERRAAQADADAARARELSQAAVAAVAAAAAAGAALARGEGERALAERDARLSERDARLLQAGAQLAEAHVRSAQLRDELVRERTRRTQKDNAALLLVNQLETAQGSRAQQQAQAQLAAEEADTLRAALEHAADAAADAAAAAYAGAGERTDLAESLRAREAEHAQHLARIETEHARHLARLGAEAAERERSVVSMAAVALAAALADGDARAAKADARELEMWREVRDARGRAGAAEQRHLGASRALAAATVELADAAAGRERSSARLAETRARARARAAELAESLGVREEQLQRILGVRALGPVHAALDNAGVYEAKEDAHLAPLAEQAIRLAVGLDEAHEHSKRVRLLVATLGRENDRLHARTNGLVKRQLLYHSSASASPSSLSALAALSAPASSFTSVTASATATASGSATASVSTSVSVVLPAPSALPASADDAPAPNGSAPAADDDEWDAGEQSASASLSTSDNPQPAELLTSKAWIGKLVDVARRLHDQQAAEEVEAVNRGHARVRLGVEKLERELLLHAPSAVHVVLAGAPQLPQGLMDGEACEQAQAIRSDAEINQGLRLQMRTLQARIGIERLQQTRRLDRELAQERAKAKAALSKEGEWLKMRAQRRVDVESSAARALPLILDDVDSATERIALILEGVRLPDSAFAVPGVPPAPAITNLDGGDFSVTVCYRSQLRADHNKTHVFNYTSHDDGTHDAFTLNLVKQTLDLLHINPNADARAKEWALSSENLADEKTTRRR